MGLYFGKKLLHKKSNFNYTYFNSFSDYINNNKTIVIPTGTTKLRNYAFSGLTKVKSIEIPNTVNNIGENCFSNSNITKIKIDNNSGVISGAPWGANNAEIEYNDTPIVTTDDTFTALVILSNILYSKNEIENDIINETSTILTNVLGEEIQSSGKSNNFEAQLILENIVESGAMKNESEIVSNTVTILKNILGE